MLQSLYAYMYFIEVLLAVQNVIHGLYTKCMMSSSESKCAPANVFVMFGIWEQMESNYGNMAHAAIMDCSHGHNTLVNWGIDVMKQNTFAHCPYRLTLLFSSTASEY